VNIGGGLLTGSVQQIDIRSITAPSGNGGYILAIGTINFQIDHSGYPSNSTLIQVGISDDGTNFLPKQTLYVGVPGSAANGQYNKTVTFHGLFAGSAGLTKTFRLLCHKTHGTVCYWSSAHMTLVYIPTARGTIETSGSGPFMEGPPPEDESAGNPATATGGEGTDSISVPGGLLAELLARVSELEQRLDARSESQ